MKLTIRRGTLGGSRNRNNRNRNTMKNISVSTEFHWPKPAKKHIPEGWMKPQYEITDGNTVVWKMVWNRNTRILCLICQIWIIINKVFYYIIDLSSTESSLSGRCLMVSALDSGSSGLSSSTGLGHCVVFLDKILTLTPLSHCLSPSRSKGYRCIARATWQKYWDGSTCNGLQLNHAISNSQGKWKTVRDSREFEIANSKWLKNKGKGNMVLSLR